MLVARGRRSAFFLGVLALPVAAARGRSLRDSTFDHARAADEAMAVDCDASSSGVIDTSCTYDVGETFHISVHATDLPLSLLQRPCTRTLALDSFSGGRSYADRLAALVGR